MYDKLKEQYDELQSRNNSLISRLNQIEVTNKQEGSLLSQNTYWNRFEQLANTAIANYPAWRKTQRKVQKTGNLSHWLVQTIGADTREAEILKKILSDVYEELI